jgi:hypothetical protein
MLASADRHQRITRALAQRAAREARKRVNVGAIVVRHQAAAASVVTAGVTAMLAEQQTPVPPEAALVPLAFTADPQTVDNLVADIQEAWRVERLVNSLVSDAARAAESVSITTRPGVYGFVRQVSTPCCSRCAILAGRVYRWDADFKRHPGCDCTEIPAAEPESEFMTNPHDLIEGGHVRGLSKADMKANRDGADLNQLVNYRRGGLRRVNFGPGRTITVTTEGMTSRGIAGKRLGGLKKVDGARYRQSQRMRLAPSAIYKAADGDRETALRLLKMHGYVT